MSMTPRRWTPAEDALLREGFQLQSAAPAGKGHTINWNEIAKLIPGRSNKDCRKRYFNEVAGCLKKGPWTEGEDRKLKSYVQQYGLSWAVIAQNMQNRSADQCSKRWRHCLDPALERRPWTDEENNRLLTAISTHGNSWRDIQMIHFPTKSANNVKNQYTILSRKVKPASAETHPCNSQRSDFFSDSSESSSQNSSPPQIDKLSHAAINHSVFNFESSANSYQLLPDCGSMNLFPPTNNTTSPETGLKRGDSWSSTGDERGSLSSPLEFLNSSDLDLLEYCAGLSSSEFGAGKGDFEVDSSSLDMDLNWNGSMMGMSSSPSRALQASALDDAANQVLAQPPWSAERAGGDDSAKTVAGDSRITFEIQDPEPEMMMKVMKVLMQSRAKFKFHHE